MAIRKKIISMIILLSLTFSLFSSFLPAHAADPSDKLHDEIHATSALSDDIERFVARLYSLVLGRPHDAAGLQDWSNILRKGLMTGASVAYEFFFSVEFQHKNVSNSLFVDILYGTLLDRHPDQSGRADWLKSLDDGWPRESIFANFVHSIEFDIICKQANIERGTYTPHQGVLTRAFVTRLYTSVLGRPPDTTGLNDWTNALVNGYVSGATIAHEFLFSREMELRNLNEEQFVKVLYNSMLGREPDQKGLADWSDALKSGLTRNRVFEGFVNSIEFDLICISYGIIRGAPPISRGSLSGKVIVLDPGHGTSGSPGAAGYNEAVAMLGLARRIRPLLEMQGATVMLTRNSEVDVPISTRCAMINILALQEVRKTRSSAGDIAEIDRLIGVMQSIIGDPTVTGNRIMNVYPFVASRTIGPDLRRIFEIQNDPVIRNNFLSISLHSNATANGSTSVRGAEVYFINPAAYANTRTYYPGFSYTWESSNFGNILLNHIDGTGIPRRSNGLRAENYAMIREINVPAVLAENGFHTNPSDRALLSNPSYMDSLAAAYLHAIMDYFR